jgi:hypothetical protein
MDLIFIEKEEDYNTKEIRLQICMSRILNSIWQCNILALSACDEGP